MKRLTLLHFVLLLCIAGFSTTMLRAQSLTEKLSADYVSAPGAAKDKATGLPQRIIHRPSGMAFVLIPAGEFLMGSPATEPRRHRNLEQQHRRIIRQAYYLGEKEVTVAQFRRFVQATKYQTDAERGVPLDVHRHGSFATPPNGDREWSLVANWRNPFPLLPEYRLQEQHPVVHVSWNDAKRFCEHFGFQLPTEAQWEYAVRAGSRTRYFWGDNEADGKGYLNIAGSETRRKFKTWNQFWSFDDGTPLLATTGSYRPNAWGLYDMVGNTLEWVEDAWVACYPGDGADETAAEEAGNQGRVLRGGSWLDAPDYGRSAIRVSMVTSARRDFIGFRVVKAIAP